MNREQALELLPEYALGLLEPAEAAEVERLLAADPALRAELQPFLQAAEALAHGYDDVRPCPAGAADRIAAGVTAPGSSRRPPSPSPRLPRRPGPRGAPSPSPLAARCPRPRRRPRCRRHRLPRCARRRRQPPRPARQPRHRTPAQRSTAPAAPSTSPPTSPSPSSASSVSPRRPEGHHYQIWSEGPYGARSAADFEGASGELIVRLPSLPRDMTRMFVTLEPDGAAGDRPQGPEVMTSPR
ncbi:hypothetical protein O0235_09225 [Tepidiforma flava]|uniref:Anti-sigma factor n=1 Tax=Tepidiforma flava TaxID=3004094 RepID=A0ABY7M4M4_9CHLR|nr:hypothetical protein [Tepidiforma flava]WBL34975.1 hypothetical protein O0235_09225 [Tepidiforma flava]